ncbi:uncharacterized protein LOC129580897 [Paramacrobiotus metropolitanus]|uniref:uncharacterized protein LOC129580897 n=1 Tax=Paramacrobiotus metropolitanus TaxID=2943436 RepID=UPI0024460582|nr:uncharacterized protein LOC129580897 [Paramacrobiotus metropolitanus]
MDGWKNRSPLAYWEARKGIGSALPQVLPKRTEPFVDLKFDLYSDAVAFERDRFQTISEEHNVAIDPTVLTFANHYNHPHKLLVADEEGMIYFLDTGTESSKHKSLATLRIHNHAIFDAKFRPEDPSLQFITASGDMGCALVDFSTQSVVGTFLGHHQNVKCLSWQKIHRTVKQPNAAPVNLIGHTKEEISGVAFNSVDPYQLATTAEDVIVWHAEPYLDRCRPSEVIGTARIDLRGFGAAYAETSETRAIGMHGRPSHAAVECLVAGTIQGRGMFPIIFAGSRI